MKIFIVEDDQNILQMESYALTNSGFETSEFSCADELYKALEHEIPDMIILDIMLPGDDGLTILKNLRSDSKTKNVLVMMVTAKTTEIDRVKGLDMGADDYISKPFSIQEVIARVHAVLKRSELRKPQSNSNLILAGKVSIDVQKKTVMVDGEPVAFSKKEFEILNLLASNPGKIFSREDLINELWKDAPYVLDRTVDVHIARIRSKLGECKVYLTNRSGYGYTFNVVE